MIIEIGQSVSLWEEENGDCCIEGLPALPKFPVMTAEEYSYATWYVAKVNERFYRNEGVV